VVPNGFGWEPKVRASRYKIKAFRVFGFRGIKKPGVRAGGKVKISLKKPSPGKGV